MAKEAVAFAVLCLLAPVSAPAAPGGNSAATITGAFADACRDFVARSTKDISHVEFHHLDGRVVRDETIEGPDFAYDGAAGDEIEYTVVKSGRTSEQFDCQPANVAPTARLEIATPPVDMTMGHCYHFFSGGLACEQSSARTSWASASDIPPGGSEPDLFLWTCGGQSHPSQCSMTMTFRGTGSGDPDGDIVSWSLDFGDGTSISGSGPTPPAEVTHEYVPDVGGILCTGVFNGIPNVCLVTLTVTDSAGQSDSDVIPMVFLDQTPD